VIALSAYVPFEINWHSIDGGDGTRTGGVYAIRCKIGEPNAGGPMTSAAYSLADGFWALITVQLPSVPLLGIEPARPSQATISWDPSESDRVLQHATDIVRSSWLKSAGCPTNPITVPATIPTTFTIPDRHVLT